MHLIDAAHGQNKAWDIAETLFNQIITNDCGKLLVYEGKHAKNQKVAIKKTYPKIYEMLDSKWTTTELLYIWRSLYWQAFASSVLRCNQENSSGFSIP